MMKIKRGMGLLAVLLALALCAGARAETYVTLAELREHAAQGWHETYQAHGKEVAVDVDVLPMPEVDACPVVQVEPIGAKKDDSRFDPYRKQGWDIYAFGGSMTLQKIVSKSFYEPRSNAYRGKWWCDREICLNGERPTTTPENVDITYDEFLALLEGHLNALTGLHLSDYRIERVEVSQRNYMTKLVDGVETPGEPLTKTGGYSLNACQVVHGMPVFDHYFDNDEPQGELMFRYCVPDYQYMTICGVKEIAVCEEDVPLLPFDAFIDRLEALIDAGRLQGVDEMEFGYVPYQDGKTYKLVPTWRVLGGYTEDLSEEHVMPYVEEEGNLVHPEPYGDYFFNAQTGELMEVRLDKHNNWHPPLMPDVITWADAR